jgi:multidrug efflux pump subunit AcrA (membrane-fusion protein)
MIRKHYKKLIVLVLVIVTVLAVSAFQTIGGSEEVADPAPVAVQIPIPMVNATGQIVPEQHALLSLSAGGVVNELPFAEGDFVRAGQVLVRLEGEAQLQAAISTAELELANAQYAFDNLYKDTDLQAAQALQSAEAAEQALDDLYNLDLQLALAEQAVADAQKVVQDTERRLRYTQSSASQADIDAQKAQVVLAKDALDKAREDFEPYANKPEDNLTRANYQARLAAAQQTYDAAVRKLNALQGTGSEIDINVAQANYAAAQAQLIEAQRDLEQVMDGPDAGDVALLEAQIAKGYRDYETFSAGPDQDDITIAEVRIANAKAQLAAAQAALTDLELVAPFDGVISELHINPNEWVAPGSPVLLLADLDNLQIETTDLGEIDVAQLAIGDIAVVTFDALPDSMVEGEIISIAPKSDDGSGVNYKVTIALDEVPEQLRWGMTAFVDIEIIE